MKQALPAAMVIILLSLAPLAARAQDSDSDGMPDSYELTFGCLMPYVDDAAVDYDSDSLGSLAEYTYSSSLNPCVADTDGDTFDDGTEVSYGSNPLGANTYPSGIGKLDVKALSYSSNPYYPKLVWTGSEYGLVRNYGDFSTTLYFSRLSSVGAILQTISIPHPFRDTAWPAELLWSNNEFVALCSDYRYSYGLPGDGNERLARLDSSGQILSNNGHSNNKVTSNLVWTGSEYISLSTTSPFGSDSLAPPFTFGRYSLGGTFIGSKSSTVARAAWTGSYLGGLAPNANILSFQLFSSTGDTISPPLILSNTYTGNYPIWPFSSFAFIPPNSDLVFTGSEFGVVWGDSNGVISFQRVSASGAAVGPTVTVESSSGRRPHLSWTGSEYGLSYSYYSQTPSSSNIVFAILSPGGRVRAHTFLADGGEKIIHVWNGTDFGVVWENYDNGSSYFARVGYTDRDGDGLTPVQEATADTDPNDWDSDNDGMADGWEVTFGTVCDIDPLLNDASGDPDHDGMTNLNEYQSKTDPCVPNIFDADGDGLSDAMEAALGTNPNAWDTDGDGLSDKFEADNATGHDPDKLLDPLDSADGNTLDFDGDGITNAHEYWNGTSLWAANPAGYAACGYWGEADNDGFITGNDRDMLLSASIGNPTDYANVFPPTGETQDLDGDGWFTGNDVDLLNSMMVGADTSFVQSRPAAIARVIPPPGASIRIDEGDTVGIVVAVTSSDGKPVGGIPVVFSIDPSSPGSATLFGGEGDGAGGRYDLTSSSAEGGLARITVRLTTAPVMINAEVLPCGEDGVGRYIPGITNPTASAWIMDR